MPKLLVTYGSVYNVLDGGNLIHTCMDVTNFLAQISRVSNLPHNIHGFMVYQKGIDASASSWCLTKSTIFAKVHTFLGVPYLIVPYSVKYDTCLTHAGLAQMHPL